MAALLHLVSLGLALTLHAIAAPIIFSAIAHRYFQARGARDPLPTAVTWTATVALLDLVVVAGAVRGSLEVLKSIAGTWLPFALILVATWATGELMSMLPSEQQRRESARRAGGGREPTVVGPSEHDARVP
jgi:hypothetical protein